MNESFVENSNAAANPHPAAATVAPVAPVAKAAPAMVAPGDAPVAMDPSAQRAAAAAPNPGQLPDNFQSPVTGEDATLMHMGDVQLHVAAEDVEAHKRAGWTLDAPNSSAPA